MKIAVPVSADGKIFEHFGKALIFKIYEVTDGGILSSEEVKTEGEGHEVMVGFLKSKNVDLVICGGIGDGAVNALSENGMGIFSGVSGDADQAVKNFLEGKLKASNEKTCSCEEDSCGDSCGDDSCGDSCGGSCGSCGGCHHEVIYEGKNAGKTVKVHYTGTLDDGTKFDSSYDRNEPLEFVCGTGMMIEGFDKAVLDMEIGEKKSIHLLPAEAYGERSDENILRIRYNELPGSEDLKEGQQIGLVDQYGRQFPVVVQEKNETGVVLDANHFLAGKNLNFDIELISVD